MLFLVSFCCRPSVRGDYALEHTAGYERLVFRMLKTGNVAHIMIAACMRSRRRCCLLAHHIDVDTSLHLLSNEYAYVNLVRVNAQIIA